MSLFLNRFMMTLYERDRSRRTAGWQEARKNAVLEGARSAWRVFAEARAMAFDDAEAPCLRGLASGKPFTLEALLDKEGAPFMRMVFADVGAGVLAIKPLEPHHRLPFLGRVHSDAEFDSVMFMRGDAAICARVRAPFREVWLSLSYRRPWLLLKDGKLIVELDGIELDTDVLVRLTEQLETLVASAS